MAENIVRLGGTYRFVIPANGVEAVTMEGRYIRCIATTGEFKIAVPSDGDEIAFKRQRWIKLPDGVNNFQRFIMRNETATAITVDLYIGFGTVGDDIAALEGSLSTPNTVDSAAAVTLATGNQTDVAADATRRTVAISTPGSNTGTLYFRDQSGTGNEGVPLPPGATISIDTAGAFRITNNTGADQSFDLCYFKEI